MSANLYLPLYLTIVTILTLGQYVSYKRKAYGALVMESYGKTVLSLVLAVFMTFFIGSRPAAYIFIDTMNYVIDYNAMEGNYFVVDHNATNYLFDNLFAWIASEQLGYSFFFLVIAAIYFCGTWFACKRIFPSDTLVAFLTFLAAFSTFSYGTNGIKAGAAAALFLIAISYRNNIIIAALMLFVTLGFHHSMIMPIAAFIAAYFYKNAKVYFGVWFVCLLMAAAHITFFQELFAGYSDESGVGYLTSSGTGWGGKEGFRIDFVIYSAMPVFIGYWAVFKRGLRSAMYEFILSIYLLSNSVWMLCMYANFTNRIAYLSWGIYPVVLIYPFLNEKIGTQQYKMLANVIILHLAFTLFMEIIYY